MSSTILVTGATGTVGTELVKALVNRGITVRAGVHSIIKGDRLRQLNPGVQLVELDYQRPETLAVAFTGINRLFLLTPTSPETVSMSQQLIDAAHRAGVEKVVKLSAEGVGQDSNIQLDRWHREIEEYLAQSGLSYAVLRPSNFMQNFVRNHCATVQQEGKFYLPLSDAQVTFIDVRDIAEAAAILLTTDPAAHAGQAYHLTGPAALTGQQVAEALSEATSHPVTYVPISEDQFGTNMADAPNWQIQTMQELYQGYRAGKSSTVSPEVERLTGRAPHTIQQFAHDYRAQFQPTNQG